MTDATMSKALVQYKAMFGHLAMKALLLEVAGVHVISAVPVDKVDDVIAACDSGRDFTVPSAKARKLDFNDASFVNGVYAKWNGI